MQTRAASERVVIPEALAAERLGKLVIQRLREHLKALMTIVAAVKLFVLTSPWAVESPK